MSKLQELINELCPDGVPFLPLKEIVNYRRGSFPQPYTNSSFYGGEGSMPFVQVADMEDECFALKSKTKQQISKLAQPKSVYVPQNTVICSIQGTIGRVAITQYNSYVDRTIAIFTDYKININKKYFAYCLHQKFNIEKIRARGSTLKTITKEEFSEFKIPIPPFPIQEEIVRILDNMTEYVTELKAELKARKMQYEYYRDDLLAFGNSASKGKLQELINELCPDGVECRKLEECCNILDRKRKPITKSARKSGIYPYYGANGIQDYVSDYIFDGKFILVGEDGSVITSGGKPVVNWAEGKIWVNNHAHIVEEKNGVLLRYLYHYIQTVNIGEYIHGNIPKFTGGDFKSIKVLVPPLPVQEEIVRILDNFSSICNDISTGLPAEIEARQKQYEYYRDKLLSFQKLENEEC